MTVSDPGLVTGPGDRRRDERRVNSRVADLSVPEFRRIALTWLLSAIAQLPATAARLATPAKASAMPSSIGTVLVRKGWPVRVSTKGRTGRMQGLAMVRTPAR